MTDPWATPSWSPTEEGFDAGPYAGPGSGDWQRLSPRMLVVHPVQELIRLLPALLGIAVAGASSGNGPWWTVGGLVVVVGLGLLRWFTTTFRVTADQVQVRRGLLNRRVLTVPRDRVRTVDVTANALHRVLRLAKLTIGTGRTDKEKDKDLELDSLGAAAASRLRVALLDRSPVDAPAAAVAEGDELAHWRPGWIRYGPFSLSGLVTVGVIFGVLSQFVNENQIDPERVGAVRSTLDWLGRIPVAAVVLGGVAALALLVTLLSTLGYLLAFWRFRLVRQPGGTLHVSRGLLTSRSTTIEERRLHGAEVFDPLLLRVAGGGRVAAIATGLRSRSGNAVLMPPGPLAEARRTAAAVIGDDGPLHAVLTPHGPAARRRRLIRALLGASLLLALAEVAGALLDWPLWGRLVWLVLLPAAVALGLDRYRSLGHALARAASGGDVLVAAEGSLVRRRALLGLDGVIGWNIERTFFQRRAGLATLVATTAAGHQAYRVPDLPAELAVALAERATPGLLTPFLEPPPLEPSQGPARGE